MKKKFAPQSAAVRPAARECFRSSVDEGGFFNLRASIGLFVFLAGLLLALFATANSLQLAFDTSANQPTEAKASVLLGGGIGIPFSETWTFTGSLNTARDAHTATLLANGMVLVVGGVDIGSVSSPSAEVYDPASGTCAVVDSTFVKNCDPTGSGSEYPGLYTPGSFARYYYVVTAISSTGEESMAPPVL